MKRVRYIKPTHDAFPGEERFLRDDYAQVLRLTGHVVFVDWVEKRAKTRKKDLDSGDSADVQIFAPKAKARKGVTFGS